MQQPIPLSTTEITFSLPVLVNEVPETKPKKEKKPEGRPTVMTKDVLQKLEDAFMNCFTDEEACLYAGISPKTLYNYQNDNEDFLQRKQLLRKSPNLVAKTELVKAIKGNVDQSRWWAQNKMSDEFSPKAKIDHTVTTDLDPLDPEREELLKDFNTKYRDLMKKRIIDKQTKQENL